MNYNPTGSGAGIKQFNASQVDFAGSDSALKTEAKDGGETEAAAAAKRCQGSPALNLPMVIGPVAIAYNVDGLDKLIVDGPTAAKIFQGTIKTWNDPAIAKLNPGAKLPTHRSRSSSAPTSPVPPRTSPSTSRPPVAVRGPVSRPRSGPARAPARRSPPVSPKA